MYKILGGDQKEYGPVTAGQLREWVAQQRVNGQTLILADGATEWKPLNTFPELVALSSPPAYGTATVAATTDNPMSVVVPYKNPKALIAYYCAIFSLIPCLGLPLGITAFILGLLGLKAANAHPGAHGKVHAWIGIILGGLCALGNVAGVVLM
ncbi:MAG TPA: GYF domain-containing protein, partial [Verrucomicrobiae bacterium]